MPVRDRVNFWQIGCILLPIAGVIAPLLIAKGLGGFGAGFQMVDKELQPSEAFGILGAMLFPIAGYFFARTRTDQARALQSQSWPTAPGKVLTSELEERKVYRGGWYYVVSVTYSYRVGGIDYQGDAVAYGPRLLPDEDAASALKAKYPVNTTVAVHYNPTAPDDSVLETSDAYASGRNARIWACVIIPFVGALILAIRALVH